MYGVKVHPTALVESASVGDGTAIWAFVHVMPGARVGKNCNIGDHTYIEGGSSVGDDVTIKNGNMIWDGVEVGDGAFIGPGVVFTNDRYPRSARVAMPEQAIAKRDWRLTTVVGVGASLGAGAVILPGVHIGEYAMVAAGAVVTRDVLPFALVRGNPARRSGWVCLCALPLDVREQPVMCPACGLSYKELDGSLMRVPA